MNRQTKKEEETTSIIVNEDGTALLLAVGFGATTAFGQGAGDDETRAKYREAASLVGEKKHDEARKIFLELWAKTKTYDVAASSGADRIGREAVPRCCDVFGVCG